MNNTDQIRQLLNLAIFEVGVCITWGKYPDCIEVSGNKALNNLEKALALLPCKTCNDTGHIPPISGNLPACYEGCENCDILSSHLPCTPCPDCNPYPNCTGEPK